MVLLARLVWVTGLGVGNSKPNLQWGLDHPHHGLGRLRLDVVAWGLDNGWIRGANINCRTVNHFPPQ